MMEAPASMDIVEIDNLTHLFNRFVDASDVIKRDAQVFQGI